MTDKAAKLDAGVALTLETIKAMLEKSQAAGAVLVMCDADGVVAFHLTINAEARARGEGMYVRASMARAVSAWLAQEWEPVVVGMGQTVAAQRAAQPNVLQMRRPFRPS